MVRIFDVIRALSNPGNYDLLVLPQPIVRAEAEEPSVLDSTFVGCTVGGGWFALSEAKFPYVTRHASDAGCYREGPAWKALPGPEREKSLVGIHKVHYTSRHEESTHESLPAPPEYKKDRNNLTNGNKPLPSPHSMRARIEAENYITSSPRTMFATLCVVFIITLLVYMAPVSIRNLLRPHYGAAISKKHKVEEPKIVEKPIVPESITESITEPIKEPIKELVTELIVAAVPAEEPEKLALLATVEPPAPEPQIVGEEQEPKEEVKEELIEAPKEELKEEPKVEVIEAVEMDTEQVLTRSKGNGKEVVRAVAPIVRFREPEPLVMVDETVPVSVLGPASVPVAEAGAGENVADGEGSVVPPAPKKAKYKRGRRGGKNKKANQANQTNQTNPENGQSSHSSPDNGQSSQPNLGNGHAIKSNSDSNQTNLPTPDIVQASKSGPDIRRAGLPTPDNGSASQPTPDNGQASKSSPDNSQTNQPTSDDGRTEVGTRRNSLDDVVGDMVAERVVPGTDRMGRVTVVSTGDLEPDAGGRYHILNNLEIWEDELLGMVTLLVQLSLV